MIKNNFINNIFKNLNQQIKYCNFKSNEHLNESFNGKTDFDILIHKNYIYNFQRILIEYGFKRRISTPNKQYYGVEDYLGFDGESGKLFHFHVHYQLILGKKYSKNYVLNLNELLWDNLVLDEKFNIYIPIPELELIILIIRICLKLDRFNIKSLAKVNSNRTFIPKNIWNEFNYLNKKINSDKFEKIYEKVEIDKYNFKNIYNLLDKRIINNYSFWLYKSKLVKSLKVYQISDKEQNRRLVKIRKNSLNDTGSWLPTIGKSIAFVGCDGAGKSTIVKEINEWLSWKISVKNLYMGRPKKYPVTLKFIHKINPIFRKLSLNNITNYLNEYQNLYNARKRFSNFLESLRLSRMGIIVLFDRYPLKEFWSMKEPMDGPRIIENSKNGKKEREIYSKIKLPDFIFLLYVDVKTSIKRKKNKSINEIESLIQRKYDAIKKMIENKKDNDNLIVINTMKSYSNVILEIKREIWERI